MFKRLFICGVLSLLSACGSGRTPFGSDVPTDAPPTVARISPAAAAAGDTVTIFGLGFSFESAINVVTIGTTATTATQYTLLSSPAENELESIAFTVPAGI